jgi:hypothetical protein
MLHTWEKKKCLDIFKKFKIVGLNQNSWLPPRGGLALGRLARKVGAHLFIVASPAICPLKAKGRPDLVGSDGASPGAEVLG